MCRGSGRNRKKKKLRVLLIGEDDFVLVALKDYYKKALKPVFVRRFPHEIILGGSEVDQIEKVITTGFNPNVIIFSSGFLKTSRKALTDFFRGKSVQASVLEVPV